MKIYLKEIDFELFEEHIVKRKDSFVKRIIFDR